MYPLTAVSVRQCVQARTMARCASSTLNAFCGRPGLGQLLAGGLGEAAASAAWPIRLSSARRARHGLVPTPPSASRTSATVPPRRTAAATDASANSYDWRSRNFR